MMEANLKVDRIFFCVWGKILVSPISGMRSRILIPFWIFEHVNWGGDDSPISKWFSPQLMPGGGRGTWEAERFERWRLQFFS